MTMVAEVVQCQCRRCGRSISTLSHSLLGVDMLRAELGGICGQCVTPEEEQRIAEGIMRAAVAKLGAGR